MFPGAAADPEQAGYAIIGAPLDASTTYQPGTRFGPECIRRVARSFEDYDHHTGQTFSTLGVHDHGDLWPAADVAAYLDFLEATVADYRDRGTTPLLIGGEHTISLAAVRALDPDVFVSLDAHLDLRTEYRGDPLSHATVTHHALEVADEAIVLGGRTGSAAEWDRADAADVTVVSPEAVPDWQPDFGDATVYLSLDIDVADPGYAPGTGTPEPFGLDPRVLRDTVRQVAPASVGFDVVEVNDRDDGQAATLAAKLLRTFVFATATA